jgi:hypothetical protein
MKVSAGNRSTSSSGTRQVTVKVTGLAHNDYVRSSDLELQIPFTRLSDTLRRVQRLGGKITDVSVTGGTEVSGSSPAKSSSKTSKKASPAKD